MTAIFLSASVPYREPYDRDADPLLIREAVVALVSVTTPREELVFGGHPAISPLVEHAARSLGTLDNVHIFQSEFFAAKMPPVARQFPNLHMTSPGPDQATSLTIMRTAMLKFRNFRAGVFIGGMEGLFEEIALLKQFHPGASVIPVASTGGAARRLFNQGEGPTDPRDRRDLENATRYRAMFRRLLS